MHQEQSVLQKFLQKPCYTRKSATWKLRKLIPFLRTLWSAARWREAHPLLLNNRRKVQTFVSHTTAVHGIREASRWFWTALRLFEERSKDLYTIEVEREGGGGASKGDIFQPPPLWHRPLAWVDEEILVMVIRMMMVRMIVTRGDIFFASGCGSRGFFP